MPFAFFQIPPGGGGSVAALNDFIRSHRVLVMAREWCDAGAQSFWAFCVEYDEGPAAGAGAGAKVDYRQILPPDQFARFARLRTLRKALAERDGQPPFALFTNAQLAEIAQRNCRTLEELGSIAGIGEARLKRYGAEVIGALGPEAVDGGAP